MVLAMIERWFVVKEEIKAGENSPLNVIGQCLASTHAALEGTTCDHFHQFITLLLITDFRCSVLRNVGTQLRQHAPHVRKIHTLLHMSPQRPRMPPLPLPPRPRSTPTPLPRKTPGFRSVSKHKTQVWKAERETEHQGHFAEAIKNQDKNIVLVREQRAQTLLWVDAVEHGSVLQHVWENHEAHVAAPQVTAAEEIKIEHGWQNKGDE